MMPELIGTEGSKPQLAATLTNPGRASSPEEAVARALLPGEQVTFFAECLRRQKSQLFEKCTIALTQERVLIAGTAFPWGADVKQVHRLETCTIVNGKERPDGSRLLVLSTDNSPVCLYFKRTQIQAADAILARIGATRPNVHPIRPPVPMEAATGDAIDTFELGQELHGLSEAANESEGEDEE